MSKTLLHSMRLLSLSAVAFATRYLSCPKRGSKLFSRTMAYSIVEHGTTYTTDYKAFIKSEVGIISPFHDIPLLADKENAVYNMVVEIPRWTNAKMEISTKDFMNPIKQDMKKGKMRFVKNIFPYKGYIWNYGALPQTWEDPHETDDHTGQKGDGDPIDVIEIGYKVATRGEVKQVKLLGVLALIDEGETDWKVIAIDVSDPMASKLHDVEDVHKLMPGLLEATYEWFKIYKIPGGAPANVFAFNDKEKNRAFATGIVTQTHEQWKHLIKKTIENKEKLSVENVSVEDSPYRISEEQAQTAVDGLPQHTDPAAIPDDVDVMYYLTEEQKQS